MPAASAFRSNAGSPGYHSSSSLHLPDSSIPTSHMSLYLTLDVVQYMVLCWVCPPWAHFLRILGTPVNVSIPQVPHLNIRCTSLTKVLKLSDTMSQVGYNPDHLGSEDPAPSFGPSCPVPAHSDPAFDPFTSLPPPFCITAGFSYYLSPRRPTSSPSPLTLVPSTTTFLPFVTVVSLSH